jgi:hypothetical protein
MQQILIFDTFPGRAPTTGSPLRERRYAAAAIIDTARPHKLRVASDHRSFAASGRACRHDGPMSTNSFSIRLLRHTVRLSLPEELFETFRSFFALVEADEVEDDATRADVVRVAERVYGLSIDGVDHGSDLDPGALMRKLIVGLRLLVSDADKGAMLRASAVGWNDKAILITGTSVDAGNVAAWLVGQGFSYLSQGLVRLAAPRGIEGFAGPMAIGERALGELARLDTLKFRPSLRTTGLAFVQPDLAWAGVEGELECALILDAHRSKGAGVHLAAAETDAVVGDLSWPSAGNPAASLKRDAAARTLAEAVPCLSMRYDALGEGEGVVDSFLRFIVEEELPRKRVGRMLATLGSPVPQKRTFDIPARTERRLSPKLTIGMATYDDYDGVYFSIQALRLYHPEISRDIEILVIDNNPTGICSKDLKSRVNHIDTYRSVPGADVVSTAVRDQIFAHAHGAFVQRSPRHVLFPPGALRALICYFDENPDTPDLIQGPILWDNLKEVSSHWAPEWSSGMFGTWANDPVADDAAAAPFEIPMQGLGVFACRRSAWPGINPGFRGFGGEEGYLHEKFRQRGGRVICLPALRWTHRFNRPLGVPYPIKWEDRIRNYILGRRELGLPIDDVVEHMRRMVGAALTDKVVASIGPCPE